MHIIIFDGSFKTTPFINRLMMGLIIQGQKVSVIGFNEINSNPIPMVKYQSLGSNQSKLKFIKTSLGLAVRWGLPKSFFQAMLFLVQGNRKALQKQNLDLVLKNLQPDVVHVQWPTLLPWLEPYFENSNFKIILSQRGYQTNVRPFVNQDYFNYLRQWFPKLSGFHSVSKAISIEGDLIYNSISKVDQVVYTGLDLTRFKFNIEVPKNSVLKIISVGRPHWKKGYDLAIKSMTQLKEQKIDFHYTIIGGQGDEEVLFLINDLGLENHISLTYKMPQEEVFEKVYHADVMLLPSIEEGIANVAVEAMALGCPVISTNCGGMEELITHNKEGWIVPIRDSEALTMQIIKFMNLDAEQIKNITIKARQKVEQQHNEEKMIKDMMNLYATVLKY